jgi:hypothetical protein
MSDPVNAWLDAQRELTERWLTASSNDTAREQTERFWQSIAEGVSPQARELAGQLMQLGPAFLAGAGDALFELFGAPKNLHQNAASFGRWLELAPLGYFREHQAHAQELASALD